MDTDKQGMYLGFHHHSRGEDVIVEMVGNERETEQEGGSQTNREWARCSDRGEEAGGNGGGGIKGWSESSERVNIPGEGDVADVPNEYRRWFSTYMNNQEQKERGNLILFSLKLDKINKSPLYRGSLHRPWHGVNM